MTYRSKKTSAFTLVEVVVALGIFIFAGFALIALLAVGLQNSRDSKEQLQAANIAEFICSTRRATPMTDFTISTNQPNFPLPVLYGATVPNNLSAATPTYLSWDGTLTNLANARFALLYNIISPATYTPKVNPGVATVYLCLYWPPQGPINVNTGHFEVTTTFALP